MPDEIKDAIEENAGGPPEGTRRHWHSWMLTPKPRTDHYRWHLPMNNASVPAKC